MQFPIVDTHQHLWDVDQERLLWAENAPGLHVTHWMPDYQQVTAGLPVQRSVYMEVDAHPEDQLREAELILDLCAREDNVLCAAVLGAYPAAADFSDKLDHYRRSPFFRGVRQVIHEDRTPPGTCLQPEFIAGVQKLGEENNIFDICIRPGELLDACKLIDACPDTQFVLDHLGNPGVQAADHEQWRRDVAEVAKRERVMCKISGIVASAKPGAWTAEDLAPLVNHCLDVFGPDRVMFGGDWPVCTLTSTFKQWVEALTEIVADRDEHFQRNLWGRNAVKFYNLPPLSQ